MELSITVVGEQHTKGSKQLLHNKQGKAFMVEDDPKLGAWMRVISKAMDRVKPEKPFSGALRIVINAYVKRPKSHWSAGGGLKESAPERPAKHRDADKVQRAIFDAGKGIWYVDDNLFCSVSYERYYINRKDRFNYTEIQVQEL